MPQLVKKVEGSLFDVNSGDVILVKSVAGELQEEDYINMNGFTAFLQNLTKTEVTSRLTIPNTFGLKIRYNITVITLNISY